MTPQFTVAGQPRPDDTPAAVEAEQEPVDRNDDHGHLAPPQDIAAEQAVLGCMILSRDATAEAIETLNRGGRDFYRPAHETIYDALVDMFGTGEAVDQITLVDYLTRHGDLTRVGGAAYIFTLVSSVATAANVGHYATIVNDRASLRRLIEAGTKVVQLGHAHSGGDVADLQSAAMAEVFDACAQRENNDYKSMSEIIDPTIEEIEAAAARGGVITGVATGFTDLDALTHGLHAGQLVVIAGRPAMGKSTLGLDIARHVAFGDQKGAAVLFSLEMSQVEIGTRVLSAEAGINLSRLRSGMLDDRDWESLAGCMGRLADGPLFIDDSANLTMPAIRAKARRLRQSHDLKLVVIDYLQLMSSGKRVESRQQEVSEFSRALKLLAKELEVPVVALSQLNRGAEQRVDKKPQLSDLRESGAIEQDADVVILVHRDDMYDKESERAGEADLIVAKHRNGPTGTIVTAFQGHHSRFANMAKDF